MRFEDGVGVVGFTEAVEEAQGIARGDGFVELADEDAAVVGMNEVDDEFAY